MPLSARFERRLEVLPALFAFSAQASARWSAPDEVRRTVDLVLEELFTNIVKYGHGQAPVSVQIDALPHGLEVVVEEPEAARFDPTRSPDVDTTLPASQRRPGGLGLHLIRRMVESIDYCYLEPERTGRVRFRVTQRR